MERLAASQRKSMNEVKRHAQEKEKMDNGPQQIAAQAYLRKKKKNLL